MKSDEKHKNNIVNQRKQTKAALGEHTEKCLRGSEERFRLLCEAAEEGVAIHDNGVIVEANQALARMYGYELPEMIGMYGEKISTQESWKIIKEHIAAGDDKPYEVTQVRKDGSTFVCSMVGKPCKYNDHTLRVATFRDVTERRRTERILRKKEEHLRGITRNLPGIIIQFYAKDSGEYGLNYLSEPRDEFLKIVINADTVNLDTLFPLFFSRIHEKDKVRFLTSIKTAVETGTSWNFEGRVATQSGEMIWLQGLATPTRQADQLIFDGILLNITERKVAEEKSRFSEEKFYNIFMTTPNCVAITRLKDGLFIDVNKGYEDMAGRKREDVIGTRSTDPCQNFWVDPSVRKRMVEDLQAGRDFLNREIEFRRSDGSVRTGSCSARSINIAGEECLISILQDITEKKRAAEELKKSEAKYRSIFENAMEGIYQSTTEGKFITVNAAFAHMAGYDSPEELIESVKDIENQLYVHYENRKRFLALREANGFVNNFKTEFYKKDGSTFWVVINARVVKDEKGEILYTEGLVEDITLRNKAEEKLNQTLESLRKAFNTTINVMTSAIEMRDPYTAGHQKKSADFARTIATEMGLDQEIIDGIRMAGTIHDIGKLSIPAEILTKPTKLTEIEFSLIKEHSRSGYEMLKNVESPWPLAEIVYQHHERMNGTGYPRNLKGDEILIEARILSVADVVEAMASHRPYRASLGIEAALEEIEKNKGILYDNTVVDTCLRLFREKGYRLA